VSTGAIIRRGIKGLGVIATSAKGRNVNGIKLELKSFAKDVAREFSKREKKALKGAAVTLFKKVKEATPVGEYKHGHKSGGKGKPPKPPGDLKKSLKLLPWKHSIGVVFQHPQGAHFHLVEYGHDIHEKVGGHYEIKDGKRVRVGGEWVKTGRIAGERHNFAHNASEAARPEVERLIKDAFADL
jgi:hypothetical protein